MIRVLAALLALTSASPSSAGSPRAGPEAYPHGIGVSVGVQFFLIDDEPLGRMIRSYGLDLLPSGPSFSISYDQRVLSWLSLGGTLALHYTEGARDKGVANIRGPNVGGPEAGLYFLTPRFFARPSFYLTEATDDAVVEFGVELSIGAGPTLFSMRGEVDAAPHFALGGALLWSLHIGCWAATLRIIHEGMWQEGLGPLDVGFGPSWLPTLDLRIEKRW